MVSKVCKLRNSWCPHVVSTPPRPQLTASVQVRPEFQVVTSCQPDVHLRLIFQLHCSRKIKRKCMFRLAADYNSELWQALLRLSKVTCGK